MTRRRRLSCAGSYADAPAPDPRTDGTARCPECGRRVAVVGAAVGRGWGRRRFSAHSPYATRPRRADVERGR